MKSYGLTLDLVDDPAVIADVVQAWSGAAGCAFRV